MRISGNEMDAVSPSSVATYFTTMRGNCVRRLITSALKRLRERSPRGAPWPTPVRQGLCSWHFSVYVVFD